MTDIYKRFKVAIATIGLGAVIAGAYSVFTTSSARAQTTGPTVTYFKSMGPLKLNPNESALIGLLLPAVRGTYQDPRFELFNSAGKLLADVPVAMSSENARGAFFHIYMADGSVRLVDSTGKLLMSSPVTDGIVTGLLLPAVRQGGVVVNPLAASVELLNSDGMRMQYSAFTDGSESM